MAVITELIEAGRHLKQAGHLGGAIEHFKQLHATYPEHAGIMFELAASWRAFGVPEQALPLFRELLAKPKSQGLPPKDMPRLYTQLGATLLAMGDIAEALDIIEEGLRLHPSYRSLRAWRIFALANGGSHQAALQDALELMLASLAPSRWDIFEAEIKAQAQMMRENLPEQDALAETAAPSAGQSEAPANRAATLPSTAAGEEKPVSRHSRIEVSSAAPAPSESDVAIKLVKPSKQKQARRQQKPRQQMGKNAVRIDISSDADKPQKEADDKDEAGSAGALKIPIDPD